MTRMNRGFFKSNESFLIIIEKSLSVFIRENLCPIEIRALDNAGSGKVSLG